MIRILLALVLSALLVGCSTTSNKPPIEPTKPSAKSQDFSTFEDDRLCELHFIRVDSRIENEINKRKLYCDLADFSCRKKGIHRNTLAMIDCVYSEKLKNQSPNVKACFNSGVDRGNIKDMTGCLIQHEYAHSTYQDSYDF